MLHNKQKVICHTLIIAVTIVMLGSSYSSVSAFPLQSVIHHHHKVFDKKQESGSSSSSSSDTKSSDNSKNEGNGNNNNKNNNQGTDDGSNTGHDNNLQVVEPAKTGEQQQGTGESVAPIETATPMPQTSCEQGSNCTDQQGLSDRDRSTTATTSTTTTKQDNTPFVLSLPFP